MMNANRALALPWNIYGDQSDALALISSGWIQAFAATAQEGLESLAITAGPGDYTVFKDRQHRAMRQAAACIRATAQRYRAAFGRGGAGQGRTLPIALNCIAGLGGQDMSRAEIAAFFTELAQHQGRPHRADSGVRFVGLKDLVDDYC